MRLIVFGEVNILINFELFLVDHCRLIILKVPTSFSRLDYGHTQF